MGSLCLGGCRPGGQGQGWQGGGLGPLRALPEISAGCHLSFSRAPVGLSSPLLCSLLSPGTLRFSSPLHTQGPKDSGSQGGGGTCLGVKMGSDRIFQKSRTAKCPCSLRRTPGWHLPGRVLGSFSLFSLPLLFLPHAAEGQRPARGRCVETDWGPQRALFLVLGALGRLAKGSPGASERMACGGTGCQVGGRAEWGLRLPRRMDRLLR